MIHRFFRFAVLFAGFLLTSFVAALPSQALEGAWQDLPNARARLLAIGDPMSGRLLAGLEIELDKNWKTYWRSPGDSGIPPTFDWSGASNIAQTRAQFPAPVRFTDEYGESVGYKKHVVFPIEIDLQRPGVPTNLELNVILGICREVCIPVSERFSLKIPPVFVATNSAKEILNSATASVPIVASVTERPQVSIVERAGTTALLTIRVPADLQIQDVFVEGPQTWFLGLPQKLQSSGGTNGSEWALALDGVPLGESPWGAAMRLTMVGPDQSFEQDFTLSKP
uniref:protein-disulfide reductase DsbD domain-containing protein n=1 Tax=Pararhizobium sp. IMCC3301 TaxID=3067904 RepID=UPI0027407EF9|nr:protein-disulfide reductase DsbD domain-containing protein [Pararhizobium sp. IMCC3301]